MDCVFHILAQTDKTVISQELGEEINKQYSEGQAGKLNSYLPLKLSLFKNSFIVRWYAEYYHQISKLQISKEIKTYS